MMDVSIASWHMKVPSYVMFFYAFNQISFASGMMDSMLPMTFGTSAEMTPAYTGPVGDFGNFASFISSIALGLMFQIDPSMSKDAIKKIFQVFLFIGLVWGYGIIPWCYMNGIMGMSGVLMFEPIVQVVHIGVSVLALYKL